MSTEASVSLSARCGRVWGAQGGRSDRCSRSDGVWLGRLLPLGATKGGLHQGCPPRPARHPGRRCFETSIALADACPELIFLNSHDGTSSYALLVGLYRAVCTNGLVVSQGTFPTFRVAHRGDVVGDVVRAALEISERFAVLAASVERMERTVLDQLQRLDFASQALALRFPGRTEYGLEPARLLAPQRSEDVGNDLWRTLNVLQAALIKGGIPRRSATNRLMRMRPITGIKEDLRINSGLRDLALGLLH